MTEVSEVGRRALTGMRAMLGVPRHAAARHAWVTICYDAPQVRVRVADDGTAAVREPGDRHGHGIDGMRERAACTAACCRPARSRAGDAVVSPRVTRRLLEEYAQALPLSASRRAQRYPRLSSLTEREREVVVAVARGLSNAKIAAALHVSETTVKSHVGRVLAKLGLRDRVQVVVLAYEAGLIRPGSSR